MKIFLDKISSATKNIPIPHEVNLLHEIKPEEGLVIAVEILEDKLKYADLELTSGRMSKMKKGDIIAVALGNRRALKGFVGDIPEELNANEMIQILNLGGVAGFCTSTNFEEVGRPLNAKVLGSITLDGQSAINIKDYTLFHENDELKSNIPLIVVSGTCMHVGKTTVACEIIKHATREGLHVSSAKLAGVAAMKDTENMKDYGSEKCVSFVDAGFTSTVKMNGNAEKVAKGAINYLSKTHPDFIVIEFGDGLLGEYGVMSILKDKDIQKNICAHIGCAHDPVGALKMIEICKEIGAPINIIAGPVSDNSVGATFIKNELNIPAYNSFTNGEALFHYVKKSCLKQT